jgi:hypothetical protein
MNDCVTRHLKRLTEFLTDLMGHESVETTKSFYAVFEQGDLKRKHDQFSTARWKEGGKLV